MTGNDVSGVVRNPSEQSSEARGLFKRRVTFLQTLLLTCEVTTAAAFGRYFVSGRGWWESLLFGLVVGGSASVLGYAIYQRLRYPEGGSSGLVVPSPKEVLADIHAGHGNPRPGPLLRVAAVAVTARAMVMLWGSLVLGTIVRLGFRPFVVVFVLDHLAYAATFWRGVLTVLLSALVAGCVELWVMIPLQRRWGIPIWGAPARRAEAPEPAEQQTHDVGGGVYGR